VLLYPTPLPPRSPPFPYTTLFRSDHAQRAHALAVQRERLGIGAGDDEAVDAGVHQDADRGRVLGDALVEALVGHVHEREQLALRSEEHTSELQSRENLVCRLLLEK